MLKLLVSLSVLLSTAYGEPKAVCYWLHGNGPVSNIDAQTCTHVHYSFVTLDSNSLVMRFQADGEANGDLKEMKGLKSQNPNLKVIAALGGGGDGGDGKYGKMVTNANSRANFVAKAVEFLNQNQFDGLDFDWEYPACPQTNCDDKHKPEKAAFAAVLKELRAAFDKSSRKLSLSVAVNAGKWLTDNAYDYPTMASAVDYINVMTYDNAGQWDKVTTHNAGFDWVKNGMNFWASQGVPKSKLLLGLPFYGISFSLTNPANHGLDAPVSGTSGALTYHQICNSVKHEGWKKERSKDGPIAYHGSQWVGYDDPISVAAKSKWVKDNGFGGVLVWEVDQDDVRADCCKTAKPMMKAIAFGLFGRGSDPSTYGCE